MIDGGIFYSGKTCMDVDCTQGACCIEGVCSIATKTDCLSSGGVYQGNGTTCTPDPCAMPCCVGCGFSAFDGSGRLFLTQTAIISVHEHYDPTPCTLDFSGTEVVTVSPGTCEQTTTMCTGSGHETCAGFDNDIGVETFSGGCRIPSGSINCGNCGGACATLSESVSLSTEFIGTPWTTVSATYRYKDCSNAFSNMHLDVYLSDECDGGC